MHNWINQDTSNSLLEDGIFPLKTILKNSLYYPASGQDGSPIRHANVLKINSFVYVDTFTTENELENILGFESFRGYHIYGQKRLTKNDLTPDGWQLKFPSDVDEHTKDDYVMAMRMADANPHNAFARWIILERDKDLDENHGPHSISLLFIRGEGAATYQALYVEQKILPQILAIIRPGTGDGGNFSLFEHFLYHVMLMHPLGMPLQLLAWHSMHENNNLLDPKWTQLYTKKLLGPLRKDGELDFQISLFSLNV